MFNYLWLGGAFCLLCVGGVGYHITGSHGFALVFVCGVALSYLGIIRDSLTTIRTSDDGVTSPPPAPRKPPTYQRRDFKIGQIVRLKYDMLDNYGNIYVSKDAPGEVVEIRQAGLYVRFGGTSRNYTGLEITINVPFDEVYFWNRLP